MFTWLTGRTVTADDPPPGVRHRRPRSRVGSFLTVASALALGVAMMTAPQSAQAVTNLDGPWTVVHGGTGQLLLKADGTYTSTCKVTPGYADAWCPAPSGTFQRGSNAYVDFYGADGSDHSYRFSGNVYSPDTITSYFGSRTDSPLVMKKGTAFVCTDWRGLRNSPMTYLDETGEILYATGSHDLLGPVPNTIEVAETAPNYFQGGQCGNLAPKLTMASFLHIDSFRDVTRTQSPGKKWSPRAIVTIQDLAGVPVKGATVSGLFTPDQARFTCVTLADGTCTLRHAALPSSVTSTELWVGSVTMPGRNFAQGADRYPSPFFTIYNPLVGPPPPPPPPPPSTHHVSDLDASAFGTDTTWEPQVTVFITDADGGISYDATVTGTFSNHSGTVTCTTDGRGACTMGDFTLNRTTKTTVFTVTGVTAASSTYVPAENSDPDGDSNGTSITANEAMVEMP